MFRRGGKEPTASADAERQALFEKLAQRPESVCPFLGLAAARADYQPEATDDHRCHAFGDPEPVSAEQQRGVCLQRGYANCPRYLRGVLVVPSDELEALRRPQQRVPPPPRVAPPPPPPGEGGRRRLAVVVLLLLLLVGGGATAWWFLAGPGAVAEGPTPTPRPSATPGPTSAPSPSAEPSFPVTPTPDPTPAPGDEFIGYQVTVLTGRNDIFLVDEAGEITGESHASFEFFSQAMVDRVEAPNGLLHWRVANGPLIGWSFIRPDSGPFLIREVYRAPNGELHYAVLPQDET
jgi:hypothetical protein